MDESILVIRGDGKTPLVLDDSTVRLYVLTNTVAGKQSPGAVRRMHDTVVSASLRLKLTYDGLAH